MTGSRMLIWIAVVEAEVVMVEVELVMVMMGGKLDRMTFRTVAERVL